MITGNSSLKDGDIIRIVVTAEDGTTRTYEIKVNHEKINLNLSSIKVLGQSLNETFKSSQTRYTLTVAYEISALTIEAKCEDSKAKVEIAGNDNLDVGTNTVTITVKGQGNDKKVYTILVTREKESDNNKPSTSGNTSTITSDEPTSSSKPGSISSSGGSSNMAKYVLVTIGCLVLFAIGGIGIYFYVKTAEPKEKKRQKKGKNTNVKKTAVVEETKEIYDYDEEAYNDDLDDTKEFNKEKLSMSSRVGGQPSSEPKYDEDVLKDIEDLFDD